MNNTPEKQTLLAPLAAVTRQQLTEQFTAELNALLAKYGAELSAEDHFMGYAECGEDVRMTVTIPAIYDPKTFAYIREWTEIDLGRNISPSKGPI